MTLIIRRANEEDAPLIAAISRQTFYDTFAPCNNKWDMDKFMNEQFTREMLIEEVKEKENIFLLAFAGDEAAGYAKMRDDGKQLEPGNKTAIEIVRLYAVKEKIGSGVGAALMRECISLAEERQKKVIWLGVWKENYRAINFYERWGFEIFGEHDFLLGNDLQKDWLMKKELAMRPEKI